MFAADGTLVAACNNSKRVLETASPPTFYLPPDALNVPLEAVDGTSYCEWKGQAEYFLSGPSSGVALPETHAGLCRSGWLVFFLSGGMPLLGCGSDRASPSGWFLWRVGDG